MGIVCRVRILMLVGALSLAYLFFLLGIPLPWLLGPMLWTIFLKLRYPAYTYFSLKLRNLLLIPLGYNIGAHITLSACQEIVNQISGITIATAVSILVSLILAWWTTRATGVSYASSAIGNMPGGLTPMLLICEDIPQADINVVAVLQSLRLILTIAVVPILLSLGFGSSSSGIVGSLAVEFLEVPTWQLVLVGLVGAILGHYLKLPAEALLGPIITTGAFSLYLGGYLPEAPSWLIAIGQLGTGMYLGTCIDPYQLTANKKLLPVSLVGVFAIIGASLLTGYFLSKHFGFSVATAFLACAPGGIAEMCMTGLVLGENVPIILAYQLFRLLILNLIMPISLKWYFTHHT